MFLEIKRIIYKSLPRSRRVWRKVSLLISSYQKNLNVSPEQYFGSAPPWPKMSLSDPFRTSFRDFQHIWDLPSLHILYPSLHPWSPTFLVPCATSVPTLLQVGPHLTMKEQWRECILQPHPHLRIATSHTSKLKSCLFFSFKGHLYTSTFPHFPHAIAVAHSNPPPYPRGLRPHLQRPFQVIQRKHLGNVSLVSVDYQTIQNHKEMYVSIAT